MKESFCGLYETSPLDNRDFLETLAKLKNYVNHLSIHWWTHCFPGSEDFFSLNFSRFSSGLSGNLNALESRKGGGLVGKKFKTWEGSYAAT
jgi:hypothetical protein